LRRRPADPRVQRQEHWSWGVDVGTLDGKVCVVTGAAGVIGRATTGVFAREGAVVAGVDVRDGPDGGEGAALFLTADLTDPGQAEGGVLSLSRELGIEFARRGVRVNGPGAAGGPRPAFRRLPGRGRPSWVADHVHGGVRVRDRGRAAGAVHHVLDAAGSGRAEEDRQQVVQLEAGRVVGL